MKTRDALLLNGEVQADAAIKTLDLAGLDPISAIDIDLACVNGATSNKANHLLDILTLVEVIDGADVLVSINAHALAAQQFFKTGRLPMLNLTENAAGTQRASLRLLFGRYLWDPMFALTPGKFRNPQLRLTFNKAAITAAGVTGFAAGNNITLSVSAKVASEGLSPQGFLMQKQVESDTSAASGDLTVNLPTDYPYRTLLFRIYELGTEADANITNVKLSVDSDREVLVNRPTGQLIREMQAMFGPRSWYQEVFAQDATAIRSIFHRDAIVASTNSTAATDSIFGMASSAGSSCVNVARTDAGVGIGADALQRAIHVGTMPFAVLPIFFGLPHDPTTWLSVQAAKKFQAILTQGNAGAVVQTVVEQLRN